MSKPLIHSQSSVRKWGGVIHDYIQIHNFLDSSKGVLSDNRHRALTHNSWFIQPNGPLEMCFGTHFVNADGKVVVVRDVGELHILEDYGGFIPTPQDFLETVPYVGWMNGAANGYPPSAKEIAKNRIKIMD